MSPSGLRGLHGNLGTTQNFERVLIGAIRKLEFLEKFPLGISVFCDRNRDNFADGRKGWGELTKLYVTLLRCSPRDEDSEICSADTKGDLYYE